MRGSRRSFATRPLGNAPDASRSRRLRYETAAGLLNQPVVADSGESPTPIGWPGSLAGASPYGKPGISRPTRRRHPDTHPGSLRDGAQLHLSAYDRPEGQPPPVRSAALRREECGSTGEQAVMRDALPPFRPLGVRECPHGRRPTPDDRRPLREAIARGSPFATPATSAFAESPWVHRSSARRTGMIGNPTLSRTTVNSKERPAARNKKVAQRRRFLCINLAKMHIRCTCFAQFHPQAACVLRVHRRQNPLPRRACAGELRAQGSGGRPVCVRRSASAVPMLHCDGVVDLESTARLYGFCLIWRCQPGT